jgi:hypothetical protein
MRKLLIPAILVLLAVIVYFQFFKKDKPGPSAPKTQPAVVSKYSDTLVQAVNHALEGYYGLSESFVSWDTAGIRSGATELGGRLGAIRLDELRKDTVIYETAVTFQDGFRENIQSILDQKDITEQRRAFHSLSENLFNLLRTIKYDGSLIYLQECPMAFNDNEAAIWLSDSAGIRNPYLGLKHPKYKSGMVTCGETKDSVHFKTGDKK